MLLSAVGMSNVTPAEALALRDLRAAVDRAGGELSDESPWSPTLALLAEELGDGQPFVFRVALASSSRSKSEAPVASS